MQMQHLVGAVISSDQFTFSKPSGAAIYSCCRAMLPANAAGQCCQAMLPGKAAGQGCRARLPGNAIVKYAESMVKLD
jgi:hypothetical protein